MANAFRILTPFNSAGLRPVLLYVTLSGFDVIGYATMLKA
jgi:hypothetical protein